jgi:NAD(P)-dependent dehydrogenase (short-subunit alcohol dehydrogenase family)
VTLRLLRAGARVFATTRFPCNALFRYQQENDFASFADRLTLLGVDLRNMGHVQHMIDMLKARVPYLSILINNAATTFTYDDEYYQLMGEYESSQGRRIRQEASPTPLAIAAATPGAAVAPMMIPIGHYNNNNNMTISQENTTALQVFEAMHYTTPAGQLAPWKFTTDRFGELVTRGGGGQFWSQRAHEVTPQQLVETTIVNQLVPSMLISQCKELMERAPIDARPRRYIISVTCREGTFDMLRKSTSHFQTNMCKSACNMITRTIFEDYKHSGIYVSSVDPGSGGNTRDCALASGASLRSLCLPSFLPFIKGMSRALSMRFTH